MLIYISLNQINFKWLLRVGNTGCVCVVECSSYASRLMDRSGCRRVLAFYIIVELVHNGRNYRPKLSS